MKALILAGGFATRLWPLSEHHAKPLLLLGGRTILDYILEKIPDGTDSVLLTNSKFSKDFLAELKRIKKDSVDVFCEDSFSDREKLGALGALAAVITEKKIQDGIFICAGDNLLPELRLSDISCSDDEAVIAVREVATLDEARKFGVVTLNNSGEVISFEEKPENPKSRLVSTGFMSLGKNLLPILLEFAKKSPDALGGIFPELLKQGKLVRGVRVGGDWFDIGSFDTYLEAHQKIQSQNLVCGQIVSESKNQFAGKVFIGEGSIIENCRISDSIVYPGSVLRDCVISQSVIDERCDLAGLDLNRKLIRSGTHLHAA